MSKEQRKAEDLPAPPPDYPRSYRKFITKGKYKGRILCLICGTAVDPHKIDRHENGESKMHKHNLAKRYAEEQQKRCEQELEREGERQRQRELELKRERERERQRQRELELERERERKRQRELELERERERKRQIEAERKRDVEALDRELEQQDSIEEAMEISSTSSSSSSHSSSSSSSSDDDSDVQFVPSPSKPSNGPTTSREKPAKPKGISLCKGDGMWRARISVAGKNRYIGSFKSPEAAATAYQVVRNELKESGLPPMDRRRNAVFDFATARAKGGVAAASMDASGAYLVDSTTFVIIRSFLLSHLFLISPSFYRCLWNHSHVISAQHPGSYHRRQEFFQEHPERNYSSI